MKDKLIPKYAVHAGEILADELKARNLRQSVFCRKHGFQYVVLNNIIKGKRSITAKTAIKLESALGINAEFWMRLQATCELDKERIRIKKCKAKKGRKQA